MSQFVLPELLPFFTGHSQKLEAENRQLTASGAKRGRAKRGGAAGGRAARAAGCLIEETKVASQIVLMPPNWLGVCSVEMRHPLVLTSEVKHLAGCMLFD